MAAEIYSEHDAALAEIRALKMANPKCGAYAVCQDEQAIVFQCIMGCDLPRNHEGGHRAMVEHWHEDSQTSTWESWWFDTATVPASFTHRLSIKGSSPLQYVLQLDGEPILGCRGLTFRLDPRGIPKLTLELDIFEVDLEMPVDLEPEA